MAAKLNRLILQLQAMKTSMAGGTAPLVFRQPATSTIGETVDDAAISPLVGEMSGRTEGGATAATPEHQSPTRRRAHG